MITTFPDFTDVHPNELVTVKVYVVEADKPEKVPVVVGPVPVIVEPPGVAVTVQSPAAGNPLKVTLPVDNKQVGWVIVPVTGAVGGVGSLKLIFKPAAEVQAFTVICILL